MTREPLSYTVRVSARARRVRLTVSPLDGLVVVVPRGFDQRRIPAIVESHRQWVERALMRAGERRAHLAEDSLPGRIDLPAINGSWVVEYRPGAGARTRALLRDDVVVVTGEITDAEACRAALKRWVTRNARSVLEPYVRETAETLGMRVGRVRLGWYRSRWGSCSATGTISLDVKLLFLPPELVRSVVVHELCHTQQLDHSPAFYELVERLDPGHRTKRHALTQAWRYVPGWVGG
ncbi:MAG: M48 family metallopeptidase [Actinomycetia bacterium]|nr:M48 family metallopeptidase [Actinomycetes bacterium]